MLDLLVDYWGLTEETENSEPSDEPALVYSDVAAAFLRLSGTTRYSALGAGVSLSQVMALEMRSGITERGQIRNVRTKEGVAVPAQPHHYDVQYVRPGRRRYHLELDLVAILE